MASFTEKVQILIETKVDSAKTQLAGLKTSISEAEGVGGKLKATTSGLGDVMSSVGSAIFSPAGIAAGVTAVSGLALKGVSQFENLGLTVDKLATATDMSAESASRWVEVAKDHGVAAETLESSLGKMNKTAGLTPGVFDTMGVAIAKNKDGTIDSSATFLNAIEVLKNTNDAGRQAEIGTAIFGRGWQSMAGLISEGAPKLQQALASVQPEKIFGAKDIDAAKGIRDGFDKIRDAGEGLMLTIGRKLAPVVAELAPKIAKVVEAAGPAIAALGEGLANAVEASLPLVQGLATALDKLAPALKVVGALAAPLPAVDTKTLDSWVTLKERMDAAGGSAKDWAFATNHGKASMEDATTAVEQFEAAQQKQADTLIRTQEDSKLAVSDHAGSQQGLASAAIHADDAIAAEKVTIDDTRRATNEAKTAADNYTKAKDGERQATQSLIDTELAAIDKKYAARKADSDAADAVANLTTVLADHKSTMSDVASATDEAFNKVLDKTSADLAAKGVVADSKAGIEGQITSLQNEANALDPSSPLRSRLLEYIHDLGNVPTSITTTFHTSGNFVSGNVAGGRGTGNTATAAGGHRHAGQSLVVGELGPEVFTPDENGVFTPNNQLNRLGSGGGTTNVYNYTTVNAGPGMTAADIVAEQRRWERRNGRPA